MVDVDRASLKSAMAECIEQVAPPSSTIPPLINIVEITTSEDSDSIKTTTTWKTKPKASLRFNNFRDQTLSFYIEKIDEIFVEGNLDRFERMEWLQRLAFLTWKVMDYSGGFNFSEECFDAVFDDYGLNQRDCTSYDVIIPLFQVDLDVPELEFEPPESEVHPHDEKPAVVKSAKIREIKDSELSGIATVEGSQPKSNPFRQPYREIQHVLDLKVDYLRYKPTGLFENIFLTRAEDDVVIEACRHFSDYLLTAMRLTDPTTNPGHGPPYLVYDGWLSYIDDILAIDLIKGRVTQTENKIDNAQRDGGDLSITADNRAEFTSFWEDYTAHIHEERDLQRVLDRYNQIYTKLKDEDQIVDAAIAFESLLNRNMNWASKTNTIAITGSILLSPDLDQPREDIREFFENMYFVRSEIVHKNKSWEEDRKSVV